MTKSLSHMAKLAVEKRRNGKSGLLKRAFPGPCVLLVAGLFSATSFAQSSSPEIADGAVGVASNGALYPIVSRPNVTQSSEASAVGSGEAATRPAASELEMDLLRALTPLGSPLGPSVIIGTDDRTRVNPTTTYPERAQVLIVLPTGRCSGALIGKDLVITAGHCVHSGGTGGSWMTSATVIPGRNGNASPYGSCVAKKLYSVVGWTRDKNPNYDFGAIKLNCEVGNQTGWLGFFWQSASLVGMQARISSYPGDKPLEQWTHTDAVRSETALQTTYFTDTVGGNSGSGVFAMTGVPAGCGGPCVHTVHAYGSGSGNSGTRITQPLFENLLRWRAE
jgi:glutamyl endopeptidase